MRHQHRFAMTRHLPRHHAVCARSSLLSSLQRAYCRSGLACAQSRIHGAPFARHRCTVTMHAAGVHAARPPAAGAAATALRARAQRSVRGAAVPTPPARMSRRVAPLSPARAAISVDRRAALEARWARQEVRTPRRVEGKRRLRLGLTLSSQIASAAARPRDRTLTQPPRARRRMRWRMSSRSGRARRTAWCGAGGPKKPAGGCLVIRGSGR
jgi:hypothetical protein